MRRTGHAFAVVVFSAFVLASTNAAAQQPAPKRSPWTITVKTDPLTDKTVYTAVDLSASDVGIYELTLKCDGEHRMVTVGTYAATQEARPIPFETSIRETGAARHVGGVRIPEQIEVTSKSFRYRIDNEPASVARLEPAGYSNVGRVTTVVPEASAVASVFGISMDVFERIPAKRLIIADVFPDEDVQFAFAALTPEQRQQMDQMCFKQ